MNKLNIFSDKDTYELVFTEDWNILNDIIATCSAVIIDENVKNLYREHLKYGDNTVISISVSEEVKTPETVLNICEKLIESGVKRNNTIVAIGGGVIQDLVTLAASIYMRGIDWVLYPTTLLAQADSCIGGKSSINFKNWKNILGNFYVPRQIIVNPQFLNTLPEEEIRSGIGEILKVFMLSGAVAMKTIVSEMVTYQKDKTVLNKLIIKALELKNNILEVDALDKGLRLKMNYGHSFGHALEAATNFGIPHGIAVTIGLDIANFVSYQLGLIDEEEFYTFHQTLLLNIKSTDYVQFERHQFFDALKNDKKNKSGQYGLIIPDALGNVELKFLDITEKTDDLIFTYFSKFYGAEYA